MPQQQRRALVEKIEGSSGYREGHLATMMMRELGPALLNREIIDFKMAFLSTQQMMKREDIKRNKPILKLR